MPRAARKKSSTGIYHIMIRGINKEVIYKNNKDKEKFIQIMKEVKEKTDYEIYGYCLMDNHAHFIIKENRKSVSEVMKNICGKYGAWFNYKHKRIGHVFQDRFKSECIETDAYLFTVLKYIINNPIKAGITKEIGEYKWDSYKEYIDNKIITDTDFMLSLLDINKKKAKEKFEKEIKIKEEVIISLTIDKIRRSYTEAETIVKEKIKEYKIKTIRDLTDEKRERFIKELKGKGLTNKQIMEITGLSRRAFNTIDI